MNSFYIPGKTEEELEEMLPKTFLEETGEFFHIGQCYEKQPAEKLRCKTCKNDKLEVASGSYFTAVRCPNCQWEECLHEG